MESPVYRIGLAGISGTKLLVQRISQEDLEQVQCLVDRPGKIDVPAVQGDFGLQATSGGPEIWRQPFSAQTQQEDLLDGRLMPDPMAVNCKGIQGQALCYGLLRAPGQEPGTLSHIQGLRLSLPEPSGADNGG